MKLKEEKILISYNKFFEFYLLSDNYCTDNISTYHIYIKKDGNFVIIRLVEN